MRAGTIAALVAVAVAAVAGGWYFGTATTPREQTSVAGGTLMFPGLAGKLHDAAKVENTHQGKQTVIEKRQDGGWGIGSMHDYPVQETKLRGVLTGLTELRLVEPRTSDPAEFSRLGVDDPNGAASSADLLRVVDGGGNPILAVNVTNLAAFVLTALGACLLARHLTRSLAAGVVAGLIFAFAPYRFAHITDRTYQSFKSILLRI